MNKEHLDRTKRKNWIKYMLANPVYFEWVCRVPFSKENVQSEARKLFGR
jgi:hypothetical protein